MPDAVHIASLLVTADPAARAHVTEKIAALAGAEIAISDPSGKIIVSVVTQDEADLVATLNTIQTLPGVASAALVYHHIDDANDEAAEPAA